MPTPLLPVSLRKATVAVAVLSSVDGVFSVGDELEVIGPILQ